MNTSVLDQGLFTHACRQHMLLIYSIAGRNSFNISATVRSDEFCTNVCDLAVWPFDRLTVRESLGWAF